MCISGERTFQGEETEAVPRRSKYQQRGGCRWNSMHGGRVTRGKVYHSDPARTRGQSHKITENLMRGYL